MSETCESFNVRDEYKSWNFTDLVTLYKDTALPFAVACFNVKGSLNTGVILRTACCFSAEKFFVIGEHRFDRRSCVGSQNYIPIDFLDRTPTPVELDEYLWNEGYYSVFIEQGGYPIDEINVLPYRNKKPCLIFGNESNGVPSEFLKDAVVYSIPQYGVMRSLNVSSAASISIEKVATKLHSRKGKK